MIQVKVAEFRNKLSSYLKRVRLGAEVVITDRETPIGRLLPYREGAEEAFELEDPAKGFAGLAKLKAPTIKKNYQAVETLLAERRRR
ncbi:type II toxin-antitoxin system prevent-host-death family antitoxin [bacterium]|nr:MAG: type II toxin-antitoxin system prevent-host-death family antitoxin [bacterium]